MKVKVPEAVAVGLGVIVIFGVGVEVGLIFLVGMAEMEALKVAVGVMETAGDGIISAGVKIGDISGLIVGSGARVGVITGVCGITGF